MRIVEAYDSYSSFNFSIPLATEGDCYARYLVRLNEMRESCKLIKQAVQLLQLISSEDFLVKNDKLSPPFRSIMKYSMEALIHHFKFYTEGISLIPDEIYVAVEAPKGEFGVYLSSFFSPHKPYRCRIKAPGFLHLQSIDQMARGTYLADLVAIIGTQDLVFGEIDR